MAVVINGSGTVTGLSVGGLPDGTVDADTLATDSVTAVKIPDTVEADLKSGRKNLIINGGFDVWQRGTSFDSSGYTADRWRASAATTSGMCQRSTDTPNSHSNYSLQINKGSGGGDGIYYRFEDSDIKSAYGKTVTISFYAKNVSGTTNLFIRPRRPATIRDDWSAINNLGDISIGTLTTGWVKYTKQLNVEDSGLGWGIGFITDAVNSTFVISQVQLEVGSQATDFEHRSYGEELALCQRYYQKSYNDGTAPGTITILGSVLWLTSQQWGVTSVPNGPVLQGYVTMPVELRAAATVVPYSTTTGTANRFVLSSTGSDVTPHAWLQQAPSTIHIGYPQNTGGAGFGNADMVRFHWTADAEL